VLRAEQRARRASGDHLQLGIGVAAYVEITAGGGADEFGALEVHADGSATVFAGTLSHGQGHQTAYAMLVSDQTGIPIDRILIDSEAKTTHDHPRTVGPLLEAHHVRRFVIITSPMHMRRSLGVFRRQGYDPVGSASVLQSDQLVARPFFLPNDDSILLSNQALYEYAASVMYWWRGWTK
jgi:uncharacterized SAM-binding protein YcdF (DUF218 family)